MANLKEIKNDWLNCDKIKIFEIPVIENKTNENDFICFDIELRKNTFYAFHVAMTAKEEKSKKIAFQKIVVDPVYSLDENLQNLYSSCINAILQSEFFTLSE